MAENRERNPTGKEPQAMGGAFGKPQAAIIGGVVGFKVSPSNPGKYEILSELLYENGTKKATWEKPYLIDPQKLPQAIAAVALKQAALIGTPPATSKEGTGDTLKATQTPESKPKRKYNSVFGDFF